MSKPTAETPLPIAVRAYTELENPPRQYRRPPGFENAAPRLWTLVLDTETTTDVAQELRIGCFRILRGRELKQEGLFYEHVSDEELALLRKYAAEHDLPLLPVKEYRDWFYHHAYRNRATVVGHNLPFDLQRLAVNWSEGRKSARGGFSLTIWRRKDGRGENKYRPRIRIKPQGARAAQIDFANVPRDKRDGGRWAGRFIDTQTLAEALTSLSLSLDAAAARFGTEHRKIGDVEHGEPLTEDYIEYLRRDVLTTEELYWKLIDDLGRHPIQLKAERAYSSASVAKAYHRAMGIGNPSRRASIPNEITGYAMSGFFGGRTECRIRKEFVPVTYVDVLSMYPTVFSLLDLQRYLTAERIYSEDATGKVRAFLDRVTLDDLYDLRIWPRLTAIVEIEPDGECIVPVRAKYGGSMNRSIGVNYLRSEQTAWYSLADVVASKVLTGVVPKVRRAFDFTATGQVAGLRPVKLGGTVPIDPREEQIFKRVIEERQALKYDRSLSITEREARRRYLKLFANSGAYGIFAELNRREPTTKPHTIYVYADRQFETTTHAPELPGQFFFAPVAVATTAAARLILAMLEREVVSRGGAHAFCDTDSMAIVTDHLAIDPGRGQLSSPANALHFEEIVEILDRFAALSPYDFEGSIVEIEDENYGPDGERIPLYAWAVSAKRYVLLESLPDRGWSSRFESQHGLGTYIAPPTR